MRGILYNTKTSRYVSLGQLKQMAEYAERHGRGKHKEIVLHITTGNLESCIEVSATRDYGSALWIRD